MNLKFKAAPNRYAILCLLIIIITGGIANGSFWERRLRNFDFFPQYHTETDLKYFTLHKNDYFKTRYFLEANTDFEFFLFKYRKNLYSIFWLKLQTGMGQTPGNVVFDPMDINFGLLPVVEYRLPKMNLQFGLEHHCFHEIDRQELETVYFNKLFLAAGSANMRPIKYWSNLAGQDGWTMANRVSWYAQWGYFIKDFFGLVDRGLLNDQNFNNQELLTDFRYAFYRRKSWLVNFRGQTKLGTWQKDTDGITDKKAYWRLDLGFEFSSRRGKNGAMIFINYTIDDIPPYENIPRFSKDRLLQIGVRLFS
ncbi:MAG: hypothetical protein GY839_21545 [candidate division Zixibacteria bacterium]|nr:hypothetical protein [candidate division Zixibacteria bacterium]